MLNQFDLSSTPQNFSISLIDGGLDGVTPDGVNALAQGIPADQMLMLNDASDSIEQVAQVLQQYSSRSLESTSIFSEASQSEVKLGDTLLGQSNLSQYERDLTARRAALGDTDLLTGQSNLSQYERDLTTCEVVLGDTDLLTGYDHSDGRDHLHSGGEGGEGGFSLPPVAAISADAEGQLEAEASQAVLPQAAAISADAKKVAGLGRTYNVEVREVEIGVDISYSAWVNRYDQSMEKVEAQMNKLIERLDETWLSGGLTKHVLGKVIVRKDQSTDPYDQFGSTSTGPGNDGSAILNAFRDRWNRNPNNENGGTHDLAVLHHGKGGGGLAWVGTVGESYRYGIGGANTTDGWLGFIHHEIGHIWGLSHGHGRRELLPRANGDQAGGSDNQFGVMWVGPHNRATSDEAQRILQERNESSSGAVLVDPKTLPAVVPYGRRDDVKLKDNNPLKIDVIANDYDANNDILNVDVRDTVSKLGGAIRLSKATGPGGRDELIYTPPQGGLSGTDYFHYNVIDGTGKSNWGIVYVSSSQLSVDTSQTSYNYDFGAPESPVQKGWTAITPNTWGDISWSGAVDARLRGEGPNAINRDFVFSSQSRTLSHKIANGVWDVVVNMGDRDFAHDNMQLKAEGKVLDADIDSAKGEFSYGRGRVTVTDGVLDLEFSDLGGLDQNWVLNRLTLKKVGELDTMEKV